jgi:hypothetical protein
LPTAWIFPPCMTIVASSMGCGDSIV